MLETPTQWTGQHSHGMSARESFIQEMEPAHAASVSQSTQFEGQSHLSSIASDKKLQDLEFAPLSVGLPCFSPLSSLMTPFSPFRIAMYTLYHCMFELCNLLFYFKEVTIKTLPQVSRETLKLLRLRRLELTKCILHYMTLSLGSPMSKIQWFESESPSQAHRFKCMVPR